MSEHATQQSQPESKAGASPAPSLLLQRKCDCGNHTADGGECAACKKDKDPLQRKAAGPAPFGIPSAAREVAASPGHPLDNGTRDRMERQFDHDFSGVRVHHDSKAAASADAVRASAYTIGSHVVFGAGRYAPSTPSGQALIAHELAHTIQQQSGSGGDHGAAEREADQAGQAIQTGAPARVSGEAAADPIQRQPVDKDKKPDKKLDDLEQRTRNLKERSRQTRDKVRKIGSDVGVIPDKDSEASDEMRRIVRAKFPDKAHRLAGYAHDAKSPGIRTDFTTDPILHFGDAFFTLTPAEQEKKLAEEFAKIDPWCVANGRLIRADLSDRNVTDRVRGLSAAKLAELRDKVKDPEVSHYADSLRTMSTPLESGLTRQGQGNATAVIGDVNVVVAPDELNARQVPAGTGLTDAHGPIPLAQTPEVVNGRVTRFGAYPKPTFTFHTAYAPNTDPDLPSGYGRGTTQHDIQAGAGSLRFHEGSHGVDFLQFLRDHPYPQFGGRVGMTIAQFDQAFRTYRDAVMDFNRRLVDSTTASHCVGCDHRCVQPATSPSADIGMRRTRPIAMSTFPGSPRLLKGGIVVLDPATGAVLRVIALQYNPDTLTRSLQIKGVGAESGDRLEALRLKGPPVETIKLEAEIDATDQLEEAEAQATHLGLHPVLAALEMLVYPSSATLQANNDSAASGTLEIVPAEAPLTVFVFGPKRIAPVRITEFSVTEEAFDASLNPIRAKVSLGMRVLTVDDVGFDEKSGSLFMAYLRAKEQLASRSTPGTLGALGITGIP